MVVHIAGLHALGSVGAAHYVTEHLPELWATYGDDAFSVAVSAEFKGLTPTSIGVLLAAQRWPS